MNNITFVKYPGGKTSELPIIKQYLPPNIANYYEPFVGGGAVYFNIEAQGYFINDKSSDLIKLYKATQSQDEMFFKTFHAMDLVWKFLHKFTIDNEELLTLSYIQYRDSQISDNQVKDTIVELLNNSSSVFRELLTDGITDTDNVFFKIIEKYYLKKVKHMKKQESKQHLPEIDILDNLEGALKAGFYMYVRYLYNLSIHYVDKFDNGAVAALYAFIRENTYSSMFRFNRKGEFNVPYGGKSYNKKDVNDKMKVYKNASIIERLSKTTIENLDFERFMELHPAKADDFLFIDPPYDSKFSEYDNAKFEQNDQKRLAEYLINKCEGNFMVIIKNTDFIKSLYPEGVLCKNGQKLVVLGFDKKYMVSFMNRNNRNVKHLIITNYPIIEE